jgi:ubiquinone/menaquinone biosynthesis C-methylase UbiE
MDQVDEQGLVVWPAAERNKQPIFEQLSRLLPEVGGLLLEIASGTGQHAVHFAKSLPHFRVQMSDADPEHLATLKGRKVASGLPNLLAPVVLDVTALSWPIETADVIYNANMVHIAPLEVAQGLFGGAGRLLKKGGLLFTYGPYMLNGAHTAESNEAFDRSLKNRDPRFGVRDLDLLRDFARPHGLTARRPIEII